MKLLLDMGNTRWKYALADDGEIKYAGVVGEPNVVSLATIVSHLIQQHAIRVTEFLVSSVVARRDDAEIVAWSHEFLKVEPVFARVAKHMAGVTVGYANTENLGVDRWLAMLAAKRKIAGASLIISAGSAITVDYLDEQGVHQGGLIVPGINLMRRALFEKTSAVKVEALTLPQNWQPGCDTLPCVANGLAAMLKGFLCEVTAKTGDGCSILLAGGDAPAIALLLEQENVTIHEYLVFEGLLCVG